jgi:PHP family Zn ribbon phosphoesterase
MELGYQLVQGCDFRGPQVLFKGAYNGPVMNHRQQIPDENLIDSLELSLGAMNSYAATIESFHKLLVLTGDEIHSRGIRGEVVLLNAV